MNCQEIETVCHGYLDGELDLVRSLAVEEHLKGCPACARAHRERQLVRKSLAGAPLYFNAPKGLERRVRSAIRQANQTAARIERGAWRWDWSALGMLVPLAAAAVMLLLGLPWATGRSAENQLTQEIVSAHVRSLMVEHKTDIASSDQHTVKPWFDGKLDFAPPVLDLATREFPLLGGRLDYLNHRPVAALVYQRHKHFINLFIWPEATRANASETTRARQGYNLINWTAAGMTYWAVSDLNRTELGEFVRLISNH